MLPAVAVRRGIPPIGYGGKYPSGLHGTTEFFYFALLKKLKQLAVFLYTAHFTLAFLPSKIS